MDIDRFWVLRDFREGLSVVSTDDPGQQVGQYFVGDDLVPYAEVLAGPFGTYVEAGDAVEELSRRMGWPTKYPAELRASARQ